MPEDKRDDAEKVDLTNPESAEQISDEDLEKVAGGFSRTTLSTSTVPKLTQPPQFNVGNIVAETVYGGMPDDLTNVLGNFDQLKR